MKWTLLILDIIFIFINYFLCLNFKLRYLIFIIIQNDHLSYFVIKIINFNFICNNFKKNQHNFNFMAVLHYLNQRIYQISKGIINFLKCDVANLTDLYYSFSH